MYGYLRDDDDHCIMLWKSKWMWMWMWMHVDVDMDYFILLQNHVLKELPNLSKLWYRHPPTSTASKDFRRFAKIRYFGKIHNFKGFTCTNAQRPLDGTEWGDVCASRWWWLMIGLACNIVELVLTEPNCQHISPFFGGLFFSSLNYQEVYFFYIKKENKVLI